MSEDLDAKVEAIRKKIAEAQEKRVNAEVKAAVAGERVAEVERILWDEFNAVPGDLAVLIRKAEADLAAEVTRVEALLQEAEASE